MWKAEGGHGGADPVMLKYIFDPANQPPDKYLRAADQRAGAWSIMTGIAANHSMAENRPFTIEELVGKVAVARTALDPEGLVFFKGERWEAVSEKDKIEAGEEVVITRVDGLKLYVTKKG